MQVTTATVTPGVLGYSAETEYKFQFDLSRLGFSKGPYPDKLIEAPTATNIGLPPPIVPPPTAAPGWVKPTQALKVPSFHYTPASTVISGRAPPESYLHKMAYKSTPSASQRYLRTPYLLPGDAGSGLDRRPTSSMSMSLFDAGSASLLNAADVNYAKRAYTAQSWTTARSASTTPVLQPAASYRTTTKDSFPLRSVADAQQQRMRDRTTSKHVLSSDGFNTTLRCPTAPLADSTALHTQRYLTVRGAVSRPPARPPACTAPVYLRHPNSQRPPLSPGRLRLTACFHPASTLSSCAGRRPAVRRHGQVHRRAAGGPARAPPQPRAQDDTVRPEPPHHELLLLLPGRVRAGLGRLRVPHPT